MPLQCLSNASSSPRRHKRRRTRERVVHALKDGVPPLKVHSIGSTPPTKGVSLPALARQGPQEARSRGALKPAILCRLLRASSRAFQRDKKPAATPWLALTGYHGVRVFSLPHVRYPSGDTICDALLTADGSFFNSKLITLIN